MGRRIRGQIRRRERDADPGVMHFEAGEPVPLDWPGKMEPGPVGTVTIVAVDREAGTITVKGAEVR
ncbi:MAG TPA: hypothetical protein DEB56_14505 [Thiobacillus sp.]|nr:hypothetical protein [Thiobacillus sp.]